MITGELRNKIDRIWEIFWTGGITNPLDVIEQFTYLLFIKQLDDVETTKENEANFLGVDYETMFPDECQKYRWSKFKNLGSADEMYDLVLNGNEVGGGSIRINNLDLQNRMFKALGFEQKDIDEKFGFLVNAFKYGAPPHGGFAFGLDRLVMLMLGCESIRDVIAFPKVASSAELMTESPNEVDENQLKELGIQIIKADE